MVRDMIPRREMVILVWYEGGKRGIRKSPSAEDTRTEKFTKHLAPQLAKKRRANKPPSLPLQRKKKNNARTRTTTTTTTTTKTQKA
jgi:hypothetical protein